MTTHPRVPLLSLSLFGLQFINYLESVNGVEGDMIDSIRNTYERACTIHLTKKPNIILNWAAFEENQKNCAKARGILKDLDEALPGMVMVPLRRAGLERRNGATDEGIEILKDEMEKATSADEKSFWAMKCAKFFAKVCQLTNASYRQLLWNFRDM